MVESTYILPFTFESVEDIKDYNKINFEDIVFFNDFAGNRTRFAYYEFENKDITNFIDKNSVAVIHHNSDRNFSDDIRPLVNGLLKYKFSQDEREWREENKPNYIKNKVFKLFRDYYSYRQILDISGYTEHETQFWDNSSIIYPIMFRLFNIKQNNIKEFLKSELEERNFSICEGFSENQFEAIGKSSYSKSKVKIFLNDHQCNIIYYPGEYATLSDNFRFLFAIEKIDCENLFWNL